MGGKEKKKENSPPFVIRSRRLFLFLPPGVRAGVINGFGVWTTLRFGVIPEKSEECRSGLSPPRSGVCMFCSLTRFSASAMTLSTDVEGVRMGVLQPKRRKAPPAISVSHQPS